MKKILLMISLMFGTLLSCSGGNPTNQKYDFSMSFQEGNVVFKCDNVNKFNVYSKTKNARNFTLETTIEGNIFETKDIYKYYYFVPLKGNKELDYKTLVFNYAEGVFNTSNVRVFSENDRQSDIQEFINEKYSNLIKNEFASDRVALLFMPGNYENITMHVGYYTSINGLGHLPTDVNFKKLEVKNNPNSGNALINFWRTVENVSFNETSLWAVSQATSLRRTNFNDSLVLSDSQIDGNNFSSGGFISNSKINNTINAGSQQQWFIRNSCFNNWTHANMNMVFMGNDGVLPTGEWYSNRTTDIKETPYIEEKPYIIFDEYKGYGIVVPEKKENSKNYSWNDENDQFIPLSEFYIANSAKDNSKSLNKALKDKKHLLLTPGIYNLDEPLLIENEDTIIFGLGLPTLNVTKKNNEGCMKIIARKGVKMSGVLFQAGEESEMLLKIGENKNDLDNSENPICLYDLFFRVGGNSFEKTSADLCVELNTNDVLGDNFWIWRADHGVSSNGVSSGIGWNKNPCDTGIIVNGDDFLVYGLMVEHFLKYQTIWNGENGRMYFYQSETPYDAPSQEAWNNNTGSLPYDLGHASYKINDSVDNHLAVGMGIYYVNTTKGVEKYLHHGIEAPDKENIEFSHISARYFGGDGYIMNVINDIKGVEDAYKNLTLEYYCNGEYR